jgi:hypothetical protein
MAADDDGVGSVGRGSAASPPHSAAARSARADAPPRADDAVHTTQRPNARATSADDATRRHDGHTPESGNAGAHAGCAHRSALHVAQKWRVSAEDARPQPQRRSVIEFRRGREL